MKHRLSGNDRVHQVNQRSGFTLIELMLSLTILSIIILLVFTGLRTGVRAWESGSQKIEHLQYQRIVLGLMKQQLASTRAKNSLTPAITVSGPTGDAHALEFYTNLSLMPENANRLVKVNYKIEPAPAGGMTLSISEMPADEIKLTLTDALNIKPEVEIPEYHPLYTSAEIGFAYLLPSATAEGGLAWVDRCKMEDAAKIPAAIKVWVRDVEDATPICVIARIEQ